MIRGPNDQQVALLLKDKFPSAVRFLPEEWSLTVTNDWMLGHERERFFSNRPEAGLLHYNGGSGSKESAFETHDRVINPVYVKTWAIPGLFYGNMPWSWARFIGRSYGGLDRTNTQVRIVERSTLPPHVSPSPEPQQPKEYLNRKSAAYEQPPSLRLDINSPQKNLITLLSCLQSLLLANYMYLVVARTAIPKIIEGPMLMIKLKSSI